MKLDIVLPIVVAVLYFISAISSYRNGNNGMTLAWASYAVANFGLIWASLELYQKG